MPARFCSAAFLLISALLIACGSRGRTAPEAPVPQKSSLILEDGSTLTGVIQAQTDDAVGIVDEKGQYHNIPAKQVLFINPVTPAENVAVNPPKAELPSPPAALEKFAPPPTGTLAIAPGQSISVAPIQTIDVRSVFPHQVLTGEITADVAAKPVKIPSGARANLEMLEVSQDHVSRLVLGLAGVNINGHLYKTAGGASIRLGTVAEGNPAAAKSASESAARVSNGTVFVWKVIQPIVLKEAR